MIFRILGIIIVGISFMLKRSVVIFFPILILFLFSFVEDKSSQRDGELEGYIQWSHQKLKWTDFQGEVPANSEFDALTHSIINLEFQGEGVVLEFNVETLFDPKKSWKKDGVDAYILEHEQIHFDITEYHSRLLRKKLKTHKYKNFDTIESDVKAMFKEASQNANKMQIQYDEQTNHSINRKKQAKWKKKMKKLMNATKLYKKSKLKVNISYLSA